MPDPPARETSRARAAPLLAGALLALPTALAYYPPMTDLPAHEAVVGILRHWGDESYFPENLYVLNLGHSNQLFHFIAWFFSLAFGTRWAVKLAVILTQLAIFHAGARFADHTGRSRWGALLLAPLALGFNFYWGFVANLLGYAALLYALPLFDRAAQAPSPRRALATCGALVLLFCAHGSVFDMALPLLVLLAALHPLRLRQRLLALAPAAFGIVFYAATSWRTARLYTAGEPTSKTSFLSFAARFKSLAEAFLGLDSSWLQALLLALAAIAAVALVEWRYVERAPRDRDPATRPRWRARLVAYRFELLAALFLLAYLTAPYHFRGAMFLHQHFLGPAWALFVLSAAPLVRAGPERPRRARMARALCILLPIAVLAAAIPQFIDSDRTHRDLDAVMEALPMRAATTFVSIDRGGASRGRAFEPSSGIARSVALRGGRSGASFTGSPICAVQIRREYRWDEYTLRLRTTGSRAFAPTHDLDRFGWVVARSRSPEISGSIIRAFLPDGELVTRRGEWLLFRSTHTVAELTSSDGVPTAGTETIMLRVLNRR